MSTSHVAAAAAAAAKSLQSCLTLCDPIDSSPPGSPVPGILQARSLEWVAISFSNAGGVCGGGVGGCGGVGRPRGRGRGAAGGWRSMETPPPGGPYLQSPPARVQGNAPGQAVTAVSSLSQRRLNWNGACEGSERRQPRGWTLAAGSSPLPLLLFFHPGGRFRELRRGSRGPLSAVPTNLPHAGSGQSCPDPAHPFPRLYLTSVCGQASGSLASDSRLPWGPSH